MASTVIEDVAAGRLEVDTGELNPSSPAEGTDKRCQHAWGRLVLGRVVGTEPCEDVAVARIVYTCKADHHATRLACPDHRADVASAPWSMCAGPDGECGNPLVIVAVEDVT